MAGPAAGGEPGTRVVATACPLDCPDNCSLDVTLSREGRLLRVDGARDRSALTAGFICSKVRRIGDHLYGPERVARPLRRTGRKGEAEFEEIGWDEALDLVASRLIETRDRHGGEAILPYSYGGSNGRLSQDSTDALLFHRLGASRLARTVCAVPTGLAAGAMTGKMPGVALSDYEHAQVIVVWGANPHATGIHLVPVIERARAAGARLVVIDPRHVGLAARADLHLAVRPGSDVAVALAAIRELFESGRADLEFLAEHTRGWEELRRRASAWTLERAAAAAGVEAGELARFVDLYASGVPAVIRCGWGVERNRNGGSAVAAILALPAVAGKFGVRGGGYTLSNSGAWSFDSGWLAGSPPATREINMNRLGRALTELEPAVHALFVYNSNALATTPEQNRVREGLAREDLFTVVFDAVLTDTARWADVVLPATTFLEHGELSRGYGAYSLHHAAAALAPAGEARPNYAVFAELAVRCGVAHAGEIPDEEGCATRILDGLPDAARVRRELAESGVAAPTCGSRPVQFVDTFPRTADRRIDLVPAALDEEAPDGLYAHRPLPESEFPLTLISPASGRTISSTFGQLVAAAATLSIHPDDAAPRGISPGGPVRVWNGLGEVLLDARVTAEVRPGVVAIPKGIWARHTGNGATSNALVPDAPTDVGGGACFNDARVEVEARPA